MERKDRCTYWVGQKSPADFSLTEDDANSCNREGW